MFGKLLLYFALLLWFVVPSSAQPTIIFPDLEVKKGDRINVDVTANDFDSLIVLQFPMIWNSEVLDFVEIDSSALTSVLPTFNEGGVDTGVLFFENALMNTETESLFFLCGASTFSLPSFRF